MHGQRLHIAVYTEREREELTAIFNADMDGAPYIRADIQVHSMCTTVRIKWCN